MRLPIEEAIERTEPPDVIKRAKPILSIENMDETEEEMLLPEARPITSLALPVDGDPNELLKHRFLSRGGGLMLIGPTGIGKSALAVQMSVSWSVGRSAFGIEPSRAMKILMIQAENDDGDIAEIREGIVTGLALDEAECQMLSKNFWTVLVDTHSGMSFCENILAPLLQKHRPDLILIDPALSYLGGETNNQRDVGEFLRGGITPLLRKFDCGALIVHHTNKPPAVKEKTEWGSTDFAYMGSGTAEWANWPRGVLALRSGSTEVFELRAGKRGGRLKWKGLAGEAIFQKKIRHTRAIGQILWEEISEDEAKILEAQEAEAKGKPKLIATDVLCEVPGDGSISKDILRCKLQEQGFAVRPIEDTIKVLLHEGRIYKWEIPRRGSRPEIHLANRPQPGVAEP
jgi:hypothetical protein